MVYLLETDLQEEKYLHLELRRIYGISKVKSEKIRKTLGISLNFKVSELTEKQTFRILRIVEQNEMVTGSELKHFSITNNKKLTNIKSFKGLRRIRGLPIRGQRTHTNAKSARKHKKH